MTKKASRVPGIMVLVVGVVAAAASAGGRASGPKYRTAVLARGDIDAVVSTSGVINPRTLVEIGAEVSGQIAKVNVDFNSPVRKGQVLAELDLTPFEDTVRQNDAALKLASAAADKARVALDTAKRTYERNQDLFDKKLVSREDFDNAKEAYLEAQDDVKLAEAGNKEALAALESSRLDLAKALIRSPMDGIVISRNITAGQTVAARFQAPVLFTIADSLRTMRLECDVDEAAVGTVAPGQRVEFTVEAFPTDAFAGKVVEVRENAEVDSDVVRYPTVCEVDNAQDKLRPGMTATVTIHTGQARNVLRVPNAALDFVPDVLTDAMSEAIQSGRRALGAGEHAPVVWTLDKKGVPSPVVIKTGLAGPRFTEVVSGDLKEGQAVIVGAIPAR